MHLHHIGKDLLICNRCQYRYFSGNGVYDRWSLNTSDHNTRFECTEVHAAFKTNRQDRTNECRTGHACRKEGGIK